MLPFSAISLRLSAVSLLCATAFSAATYANTEATTGAALEHIEVKGRAQTLYRVNSSSLATRTDTPLDEVPQNIQVLPEALIRDQAARQITDLYRSMSGVSGFSYSGVTFRGFRQDEILYDGVRGDPFNGFAVPQLFNVAEIQVLKGAAGALYGSMAPGGLINYSTKKPTALPERQLKWALGNDSFYSGSLELSGPLTDDAAQRYRAGVYKDSEQPFRQNTDVENQILDFGYAIDLTQDTTLTLQYTDVEQDYGGARLRGVVVDDNGNFLTDRSWNHNESSDFQLLTAEVYQARLEQQVNAYWSTDVTVRGYQNQELQNYHEPFCSFDTDDDGVIDYCGRQFRDQNRENDSVSLTWNNIVELSTGDIQHTLLMGADYLQQDSFFSGRNAQPVESGGVVPGLSLVNPQYGLTSGAAYNLDAVTPNITDTQTERKGVYLQDQLTLSDNWNLLLGLRWDSFEDTNQRNGSTVSGNDTSWRLGTTYQLTDYARGYLVAATGFVPQSASSQAPEVGGPFAAETSRLYEAGVRFSLLNDSVRLNTALYQITRKDILQADPRGDVGNDGRDDLLALGEVRSRGFELDVLGDLTDNWVMNLNYAYNDTRVMQDSSGITNAFNGRFANAPRHQLGLWSRYELPALHSSFAAGVDYVGEQQSIGGQPVKAYTVFDISWQTEWQSWLVQLNVKNLFDKTYASSGFIDRTGHFPGEPRRLYLTTTYSF
ncbi:TonB-dependent siderophore receptor [Rheinheimera sp.]|uniref:TonB-dependent siderophore receptor n=1 Tax=Rheinheimera sp. TaxID=1869214 RepID=UPI002735D281|nr:TonB-dependent siderophore receptor [Rheinheimera sp.]MDP2714395.1 TonB-dependent siderophore receptor [Rheinheimera sp.]